jgi:hypothetical protein
MADTLPACEWCGGKFAGLSRRPQRFCSKVCRVKWHRKGDRNPPIPLIADEPLDQSLTIAFNAFIRSQERQALSAEERIARRLDMLAHLGLGAHKPTSQDPVLDKDAPLEVITKRRRNIETPDKVLEFSRKFHPRACGGRCCADGCSSNAFWLWRSTSPGTELDETGAPRHWMVLLQRRGEPEQVQVLWARGSAGTHWRLRSLREFDGTRRTANDLVQVLTLGEALSRTGVRLTASQGAVLAPLSFVVGDGKVPENRREERATCTVFSLSVAGGIDYDDAHAHLAVFAERKLNRGAHFPTHYQDLEDPVLGLGFVWHPIEGRVPVRKLQLPIVGRFIVWVREHVIPVVDGVAYDRSDTSGKIVKGYWEVVPLIDPDDTESECQALAALAGRS